MGSRVYPRAKRLLITADGGGSNGTRCRLWMVELQRLADEVGLHITENWRGRPLVNREVVVNLIGSTTTKTGLEIRAELDGGTYPVGREVTEQQMESLRWISSRGKHSLMATARVFPGTRLRPNAIRDLRN